MAVEDKRQTLLELFGVKELSLTAIVTFLGYWVNLGAFSFFVAIGFISLWWWYKSVFSAREPTGIYLQLEGTTPEMRSRYSRGARVLWALLPLSAFALAGGSFLYKPSLLNLFRKDFPNAELNKETVGTVPASFEEMKNPSPLDKEIQEMNQWVKWMDAGVGVGPEKLFLFIRSEPFGANYRDVNVVVLADETLSPGRGVAFLMKNTGGASWFRPVYRQMLCRGDRDEATGRLFRVTLHSPDEGERLLLFLELGKGNGALPSSVNIKLRVES